MLWAQVESRIKRYIRTGTDLNTTQTTYRNVRKVRKDISSVRYGYKNEEGFQVQIGNNTSIAIPMSMLKVCFGALSTKTGYDGKFFRHKFPDQASDHPCHVHIVGQILVKAKLAKWNGKAYC